MSGSRMSALVASMILAAGAASAQQSSHQVTSTGGEDGVQIAIDIEIYQPHGLRDNGALGACPAQVPVILHSHGWGGSKTSSAGSFQNYMDACLGVVSISQRGFGASGGQANVEDPNYEGQDFKAVIDYVATLPWVKLDSGTTCNPGGAGDPVLGAIGGSYGGGFQWATAFTEMRDHGCTRMNALAPDISWYDLPDSLAPQGVVRTEWVLALYAAGASKLPAYVHEAFYWGLLLGYFPDGTLYGVEDPTGLVPDLKSEFHTHGPVGYVDQGLQLDIPVLITQGMPDNLFNLNQGIRNFTRALTPAAQARSVLIGHNGGHALPQVLPPGNAPTTIATGPEKCAPGGIGAYTIAFFKEVFAGDNPRATLGLDKPFNLTATRGAPFGEGRCVSDDDVSPNTSLPVGPIEVAVGTSMIGVPLHYPLAQGPITVTGVPTLSGTLTTVGFDVRVFVALSVGTTPGDALVVQNNMLPIRQILPAVQQPGTWELPGVAVDVPAGQQLFLTVTPVVDQFIGMNSRTPGLFALQNAAVGVNEP